MMTFIQSLEPTSHKESIDSSDLTLEALHAKEKLSEFSHLISHFSHLFSSTIVEKFTQDYLWLSVATRNPWSQVTRVQRLSCCMTLLLCDMVINVMFWKMGATTAKRGGQSTREP